jgi:hypothetical protein
MNIPGETKYFTKFIHSSDAQLIVEVPANRYLEIIDFKTSHAQIQAGQVIAFQGPLARVVVATANTDKRVVLAGPITATVNPIPADTLFITYLLGPN